MFGRRHQGATWLVSVLFFLSAGGAGPVSPAGGSSDERLRAECEQLLALALRTPYGWGWKQAEDRPPHQAAVKARRLISFDTRRTAATALLLHLAGHRLGEARFEDAAVQGARALAAVQANSGQIPTTGVIRANAGGRDEPALVPARDATCAALGLLLTLVNDGADGDDGPLRRSAAKAAHWLLSQQTRAGGWLSAYPPDAPVKDASRLIRLDTPAYRDATVALLLAAHLLGGEKLQERAAAAVDELLEMRIADPRSLGRNLWSAAYTPEALPEERFSELGPDIDLRASRYAVQTLLADSLFGDDDETPPSVTEAAGAMAKLSPDGHWRRRYELHYRPTAPEAGDVAPAAPVAPLFEAPRDDVMLEIGLPEVFQAAKALERRGPHAHKEAMANKMPLVQRAALILCGLWDDALTLEVLPEKQVGASPKDEWTADLRRVHLLLWEVRPKVESTGVK